LAKILVVDDNAINRKLLVALLSFDSHLTVEAVDGIDGLAVARAERPQLVISDFTNKPCGSANYDAGWIVRSSRFKSTAYVQCARHIRILRPAAIPSKPEMLLCVRVIESCRKRLRRNL
jgi:CheY-like chemotaxis protein